MTAYDNVFGVGHRVHPVTKRPLESGIGALPDDQQAALHLHDIEHEEGKEVADKMRKLLSVTPAEREAVDKLEAAEHEAAEHHHG